MKTNVLNQDNNQNQNQNQNNQNNSTKKYNVQMLPVKMLIDNESIESLTLSNEYANSVFIGKITGTTKRYLNGIAVTDLRKVTPLDLIKHLLFGLVAEFKTRKKFEAEHTTQQIANETNNLNVEALKLLKSYLNTSTIYRVNDKGQIVSGLRLAGSLSLRDTALKITDKHLIATCKKENLKAVLHAHAKAVTAQFQYINDIATMIKELATVTTATTTATTTKAKKTKKATTTTATLTAETTTATATA